MCVYEPIIAKIWRKLSEFVEVGTTIKELPSVIKGANHEKYSLKVVN